MLEDLSEKITPTNSEGEPRSARIKNVIRLSPNPISRKVTGCVYLDEKEGRNAISDY